MKVLAFGIVREIFGSSMVGIEDNGAATVNALKRSLEERFPKLKELGSYMIAVNNEYANEDQVLHANDEVAIIPPVSGG